MNSDPLNQLWQQQPLPTAQAYRYLRNRSDILCDMADECDGLGRSGHVWMYSLWILIGVTPPSLQRLPFAALGTVMLLWRLWAWDQRRRSAALLGTTLLGEVDRALSRIRQNQLFYRWMGWVGPAVFLVQGCWLFWPNSILGRTPVTTDWLWSGVFLGVWVGITAVLLRLLRIHWMGLAARQRKLTSLCDELRALDLPDAER